MKILALIILSVALCACPSMQAQSPAYTTVTATLTDSSSTVWANASFIATIQPPFNNPAPLTNNGTAPISPVVGFSNGSGVLTTNLDDTSVITPKGATWNITICPNASVSACSQVTIATHGTSQNFTSVMSTALVPVTVQVNPMLQRAYNDGEVTSGQGGLYWRVADNHLRGFNGSAWQDVGSGGGGGISSWDQIGAPLANLTLAMSNFLTNFQYGSATGNGAPDLDISDSNTNNGTNVMFRVHTGTSSNSTPVAFCAQGLVNCVMMTTSGILEPVGNAQIIATSVNNGTAGIGTLDLGSNGAMTNGNASQIRLAGNFNKLYVSENASNPYKVPMRVYSNGATITQTGDVAEHTIYTVPNFPAQLADGRFRILIWFNPTTQGAGNSHLRIKVNGLALIDQTIVTAQQGGYAEFTVDSWMSAATNNEQNVTYFNSNAPLAVPIIVSNTALDMSAISTITITYQGANNTDFITFKGVDLMEL